MATALLDPVIAALNDGSSPGIEPRRLAAMLQITQADLADLAGVHRTTLARNPGSPDIQAKLGPIATILSRATDMANDGSGGLNKAVVWFRHQPIAAFGFKRAADLVQAGEAQAVIDWLDALEDGAYA
jgi:uncharacterized protein (DUF2384 family)